MSIKGELTTTGLTTTGDTTVEGCINGIWIKGKRDYRSSIFISTREELDNPSISSKPLPDDTIAIGYEALKSASEHGAIGNIAIGREAGRELTNGSSNICIGEKAGYSMTKSEYNICIGFAAGHNITTGTHNIAIGSTNSASSTGKYNIAIGTSVPLSDLNRQVAIGNIRQVRFPATTTGAIVWAYFQLICPYGGFVTCVASSKSLHGYKLRKENDRQLITIYNTGDMLVKTIGNNQNTLGEELIILCNYGRF